jgi:hypothetical protein
VSERRTGRSEDGAYLILYALLAVALFTMAAIVLDLAALRSGRRADRTAADLAATAGVVELDANDASSVAGACRAAWGYVLANRTEAPGAITAPDCAGTFLPSDTCSSALTPARTATGTIGDITIEITNPVPDPSPLMRAETQGGDLPQSIVSATDGAPCERLAVRIVHPRTFLLSPVVGIFGETTDVHSVARPLTATSATEVPGLVALERTGCDGLSTTGSATLTVQGAGLPGLAVVDSDASTCAAGFALDVFDGGGSNVSVLPSGPTPGAIRSFALGGSNFAKAYDPADTGAGRLSPTPSPALTRTGRSLIDNRYNCTSACGPGLDFVDQLEAADGGPGAPAGHAAYPDPSCVVLPATTLTVVGDTFVDCPLLDVQGNLTFEAGSVVFAGDVIVRQYGCLAMNDTSCGTAGVPARDGVVFVRGGLTKEVNAQLHLAQTFLWCGGAFAVPLDPNPGGTSALRWSAPLAGPFEDLLLWDESAAPMVLDGQETLALDGTVFVPNTLLLTMEARNATPMSQPMQVVASRVQVVGAGGVTLRPAAGRATGALTRQVRLIR